MWSRYRASARRPGGVSRNVVLGRRPSKVFSHATYPASSSFRAWTLRLPAVAPSSRCRSLNASESFAARALTIPSRIRSWIRRSRRSAGAARSTADRPVPAPDRRAGVRLAARGSATVPPRDRDAEHREQPAESRSQERVAPCRRGGERDQAEHEEAPPHSAYERDRERATGDNRRAEEQEPGPGQEVVLPSPHERGGQDRPDEKRRREARPESPAHAGKERRPPPAGLLEDPDRRDGDRDHGFDEPDAEPAQAIGLARGDDRGAERRRADDHLRPAGHRREGAGGLHRLPDEPEVLDDVRADVARRGRGWVRRRRYDEIGRESCRERT